MEIHMRMRWCALIGALGMLLITGCSSEEAKLQAKIDAGRDIYETGGAAELPCATCHSLDGSDLVGPSFEGVSERAATRIEGVSAEDYIHQSIITPSQYVVPEYTDAMPKTYSQKLSEEDIDNVVAFLMTQ